MYGQYCDNGGNGVSCLTPGSREGSPVEPENYEELGHCQPNPHNLFLKLFPLYFFRESLHFHICF